MRVNLFTSAGSAACGFKNNSFSCLPLGVKKVGKHWHRQAGGFGGYDVNSKSRGTNVQIGGVPRKEA